MIHPAPDVDIADVVVVQLIDGRVDQLTEAPRRRGAQPLWLGRRPEQRVVVEHEQRAVPHGLQVALEAGAARRRRAEGSHRVLGRDVGRAAVADEAHGAEERRAHGFSSAESEDTVWQPRQFRVAVEYVSEAAGKLPTQRMTPFR